MSLTIEQEMKKAEAELEILDILTRNKSTIYSYGDAVLAMGLHQNYGHPDLLMLEIDSGNLNASTILYKLRDQIISGGMVYKEGVSAIHIDHPFAIKFEKVPEEFVDLLPDPFKEGKNRNMLYCFVTGPYGLNRG